MNKIKVKDDPTEAPSINADTLYFIRLQFIKPFVEAIVVGTNVDISIKSRVSLMIQFIVPWKSSLISFIKKSSGLKTTGLR